jgi:hypothetical protein
MRNVVALSYTDDCNCEDSATSLNLG